MWGKVREKGENEREGEERAERPVFTSETNGYDLSFKFDPAAPRNW